MDNMQAEALEKIQASNLGRAIDFVKFAEAKNAALLTFSSAWMLALCTFWTNSTNLSRQDEVFIIVTVILFLIAALFSLFSFLPITKIAGFFETSKRHHDDLNLLFFGDICQLHVKSSVDKFEARYITSSSSPLTKDYFYDLSVQTVINSRIAQRKFNIFDWAACLVIIAFFVMAAGSICHAYIKTCETMQQ